MFTSAFVVKNTALKYVRGENKLTQYSTSVDAGSTMSSFFCSICGSLMYRRSSGYPDVAVPRIGTIDDLELHETKLRPQVEVYCRSKVGWFGGVEGIEPERQIQAQAENVM
ncbi:hypothetical protein AUEXF2481DRAFT_451014 [Aureobasidium subglaciale EXF-2481]|uniref:CENP-V/GFA domain-containing protein n=1 Tax=Aureobasidium subglaciale (strain EXF-2481) TaxID=1043005 RepID=A0A074Y721_AURSE|nr:uncharacterized protein AUEXF2481DRAFT_451014 [Aureobasidium subglaciale EXF-2481]KEQ91759.1 hypothetical protein AUEXF2481DRAFT_451014 [Aureobasidium subglaciale EXF-2481]